MEVSLIEWVGYLASAMIVVSLLMGNIVKLRILNSIGCLLFVIYGCVVSAYPVVLANGLILIINIYHLCKLRKK